MEHLILDQVRLDSCDGELRVIRPNNGVLLYCNLVYVRKLTVKLHIIHKYWAENLYFGLGRFSFLLVLVSVWLLFTQMVVCLWSISNGKIWNGLRLHHSPSLSEEEMFGILKTRQDEFSFLQSQNREIASSHQSDQLLGVSFSSGYLPYCSRPSG